jgi:hypothetical protein
LNTGPDKRRYALKMKEFYLTPGSACANNIFTAFVSFAILCFSPAGHGRR